MFYLRVNKLIINRCRCTLRATTFTSLLPRGPSASPSAVSSHYPLNLQPSLYQTLLFTSYT